MGACEACFKSKERCQLGRDQPSCSRCLRLGKTCYPRTKKRFGRPPIVKNFDYGTSGLFGSRRPTSDILLDEVVFKQQTKPAHLEHGKDTRKICPKAQSTRVADLVIYLIPGILPSSGKQMEHILTTNDAFFHLHRHWLIAKSLSSKYQHTVRRLFSHSPLILSEGYQAVIEQLSARHLDFKEANSTVDLRGGTKCLGELVKSSSALKSVEDAAVILMLGQIMFVYNVLIAWPCTHLIIRNTLLTTKDWFPAMLKMPEWDAATLTPVFVDIVQCLVERDIPVLRAQINDRIVVDRFLGISSSLLPLLYDLCVCSHRVKIHAPEPVPPPLSKNMEENNDDAYSTIERQIAAWEPDLSADFSTEYSQVEASALLAQARLYKTAALILIHRLRHPLGIHDEIGQSYAESMLRDISNFTWRVGNQDASGIGANFLSLLIALELPEQGSSLIRALEPFRFHPNQYLKILEFVEYVRVQHSRGFNGLWFDFAEDGLFGAVLPLSHWKSEEHAHGQVQLRTNRVPHGRIPPQKDLVSEADVENIREKFPNDRLEIAIQKWARERKIKDIFFYNDQGERCKWGEEFDYAKDQPYYRFKFEQYRFQNRHYRVYPRGLTLKQIDKPKPYSLSVLVAHRSEFGWNLPRKHKRHILNFPTEILEKILKYAVCVEKPLFIAPSTVVSNWWTEYSMPGLMITDSPWARWYHRSTYEEPTTVYVHRRDRYGHFVELREMTRPAIDATALRASRELFSLGTRVLYGANTFIFSMTDPTFHGSPPNSTSPGRYSYRSALGTVC